MAKETKCFEFGPFRLEVRERRLTRDGHSIALRGRVFDTLRVLLINHGRLVTKDELMAAVWPDSMVEESNLNHNICILRRALGEKVTGQKYVETVPRQGYRFVAEVREFGESDELRSANRWQSPPRIPTQQVPETAAADPRPDPSTPSGPDSSRQIHWSRYRAVITLLAVAGVLAVVYVEVQRFGRMSRSSSPRTMLVVLPFENLTGHPAEDYISDGLNQEIISQLARWNPIRLGVIGRTSSKSYYGTRKSIGEIGRELGVDYIVEGSVRRNDNRVRITVLLVRVKDQAHIWAANYDGNMDNILKLQVEVAREIAREIGTRITFGPNVTSRRVSPASPGIYRSEWDSSFAENPATGRIPVRRLSPVLAS